MEISRKCDKKLLLLPFWVKHFYVYKKLQNKVYALKFFLVNQISFFQLVKPKEWDLCGSHRHQSLTLKEHFNTDVTDILWEIAGGKKIAVLWRSNWGETCWETATNPVISCFKITPHGHSKYKTEMNYCPSCSNVDWVFIGIGKNGAKLQFPESTH